MPQQVEMRNDERRCCDLATIVNQTGLDRRTARRIAVETGSLISIGHGKRPRLLILTDKFWTGLEKFRVTD